MIALQNTTAFHCQVEDLDKTLANTLENIAAGRPQWRGPIDILDIKMAMSGTIVSCIIIYK